MEKKTAMIIRRSIQALLQNYNSLISSAALLLFPVSSFTLLSQAITSSSSSSSSQTLRIISSRLGSLFDAAGFPSSSYFFSLLNLKLSQTIFSFGFMFPISISFLLLAKASIIKTIHDSPRYKLAPPPLSSLMQLYPWILTTFLVNSFLILSAHAAVLVVLMIALNLVDVLGLVSNSNCIVVLCAFGAVLYSLVLASITVICNLGIIVAAAEKKGGFMATIKACVIIRGRLSTGLTLALPANLGMAAVEALFQFRVLKPYISTNNQRLSFAVVGEGLTIIYMYSVLMVFDVILSCMFHKECKLAGRESWNGGGYRVEMEPDEKGLLQV